MGAIQSNLSKSEYQYDLVLGTTAKAINSKMKEWLDHKSTQGKPLKLYFKEVEYPDQTITELMTEEEYKKIVALTGIDVTDPTQFPSGSYSSKKNEDLKRFKEKNQIITIDANNEEIYHYFKSAVYLEMGLPKSSSRKFQQNIPDIVEFTNGKLHFTLMFKQYKVIEFNDGKHKATLSVASGDKPDFKSYLTDIQIKNQKDKRNLWSKYIGPIFRYEANLSTTETAFKNLPITIQEKVKNLHGDQMFALDQLYLDLTSSRLLSTPDLDLSNKVNQLLINASKEYFDKIDTTNAQGDDAFIFGYFVKKNHQPQRATLVPTNVDFKISPCMDHGVEIPELNTLNYLVMTKNRDFPNRKQSFNWNWIEKHDGNIHGTIAIRREVFADYIKSLLFDNGKLSKLLQQPKIRYSARYTMVDIYYAWHKQVEPSSELSFTLEQTGTPSEMKYLIEGEKIFEIYWDKYHKDKATAGRKNALFDTRCEGKAEGRYFFQSFVKFHEKKIIFFAELVTGVQMETPRNHRIIDKSNYLHYKLEKEYVLKVDGNGKINVTKSGEFQRVKENTHLGNEIQAKIDAVFNIGVFEPSDVFGKLEKTFKDYSNEIDTYINQGLNNWIFPGTDTFTFSDIKFSEHQDLVATITYKLPQ